MTDEGQTGLGDFGPDGTDEASRPEEEAVYVAGDGAGGAEVVDPTTATLPDAEGTVEMTVTQVDYTVSGRGDAEEPLIHVFGRRADETGEHVVVRGFEPYFYAPTDTVDAEDLATRDKVTGFEEGYESIRGRKLTKIFGQTPRDVGQMRDDFEHYEADVLFPNRFLIDKDIGGGVAVPNRRLEDGRLLVDHEEVTAAEAPEVPPRMNVFDIEVDDRSGFPEDGEEPIVCLASHDSYRDEYVVWLFEAPDGEGDIPDALDGYDPLTENADYQVRAFESEEAMLDAFLTYVSETDPDVLSGWNFSDFDAPYLLDRLEVLQSPAHEYDLSIDRLSRVDEVWRSGWGGPDVKGRVVFDLLRAYKSTQFSELESYRLDAVGEAELGVGKERYAGDIGDLWEENPERLLEYNLRDVELCVELDRKQDIVQFWMEVKAFVGCLLEDAPTPGDAVDMYVMHEAHDQFVLPSKGQQEAGEEFEGGAVFEPITGVREMVSVLDLKSLYPMSMATINASPETRVDPDLYDGETYRSPDGTHFRKEPDGMMREMIDALLTERERKKEQRNAHDPDSTEYNRYDQQQAAVKRVMNSLYGVSGWEQFRLYDKDAAAAITATGRSVIEFTDQVASEMNYQVAYGDTDSVMLELGGDVTTQEAIDSSFEIEEAINDRYDDYAREQLNAESHRFQIEFEKLYRRFFQAGKKKRYAGHIVWKEGKEVDDVDITGFEYQRSDIAGITKEVQHRVIELLVREGDVEGVEEYVHETIEEFKQGNLPLDEVGIPGGIGKKLDAYETDTAQVRGAKYANVMLGTNFTNGSKPMRLYIDSVHPDFWRRMERERGLDPSGQSREDRIYREFKRDPDVICFEYADQVPDEFGVDWDKMLEKTLKGPIARILEALDVSWDEVETGQEQTGLGSFM